MDPENSQHVGTLAIIQGDTESLAVAPQPNGLVSVVGYIARPRCGDEELVRAGHASTVLDCARVFLGGSWIPRANPFAACSCAIAGGPD